MGIIMVYKPTYNWGPHPASSTSTSSSSLEPTITTIITIITIVINITITLWWTNIAMEHGHRKSGFSH